MIAFVVVVSGLGHVTAPVSAAAAGSGQLFLQLFAMAGTEKRRLVHA